MPLDAELLADRRRLRRKVSFWRVLSFLVLIGAAVGAGVAYSGKTPFGTVQAQIARISVSGVIAGSQKTSDLLKRVGDSASVRGVVVSISSPGGTTTGSEELFRAIRRLAEKKPTVAFVDGTAASGGYITALGADHIVARETSLVGSIGVLFQFPNVSKLLDKVGVDVEEIKSSPLKAEPSGFHPTSPEARAALAQIVGDTFDWFKTLVAERRSLNPEELAKVSDGRVFNGRQGIGLKLVDELGDERQAVAWLERNRGVPTNLPVRDWKPTTDRSLGLWTMAASGAALAGLGEVSARFNAAAEALEVRRLDGLLALWQPGTEKQ
jgi:protease-4